MKLIARKPDSLYIKRDVKLEVCCDFCGGGNSLAFESEYDADPKDCNNVEMQICYDCVAQLAKLLPTNL